MRSARARENAIWRRTEAWPVVATFVDAHTWSQQPIRLKLLIGEVRLGDIVLPGLVKRGHFADVLEQRSLPEPPADGFPAGIDVIKHPSVPTDEPLPRITLLPLAIRYVPARYRRH